MKILIPVDGSAHANAALDFVASRTTLLGQEPAIELINVQTALSARVIRAVGRKEATAYQRAHANDVLRPALLRLKRAGIAARASYALGNRSDAIGAAAVRRRADLIVMGSRGHSGLKGLVFGSMTNAVLAGCTKPLLVLRSEKAPQRDSLAVGIAVDGSRYGLAAVRWAIKHRALFGAEPRIELIHVHEDSRPERRPSQGLAYRAMPLYVQAAVDDASAAAFAVGQARHGCHADSSARQRSRRCDRRLCAQAPPDVLVMGSHGHGAFKSLVLGSVAMRVAARCDTPLLLIREPGSAR